jgi:maltose O-acetyltransferase
MVSGETYRADDPELLQERARARSLTALYNATGQNDAEERRTLLEELLGTAGEGVWIEPPFFCDYGWNITLEERVFLNFNCVVLDVAPVRIGALTQIASAVQISAATHPTDPRERERGVEYGRPIDIGRNVWIGAAAVIGPGVTIGDDTVVGAGSVVVRDLPAGVVAVGNPCRPVREL